MSLTLSAPAWCRPRPASERRAERLRRLSSAHTMLSPQPDGRMVLHIEHQTLRGVTPEMLRAWFEQQGVARREVEKLDDEGLTRVRRIFGIEAFRLEERFRAVPGGTDVLACLVVGASGGWWARLFNHHLRPRLMSDQALSAWLQHSIEEVGRLEALLPALLAPQTMPG